jgi:hypothetical protein
LPRLAIEPALSSGSRLMMVLIMAALPISICINDIIGSAKRQSRIDAPVIDEAIE